MKKSIVGFYIYLIIGILPGFSQSVYILVDNTLSQDGYAHKLLSESLKENGYTISRDNYISVKDFVESGASAGTGYLMKVSPLDLADRLERDCMRALDLLAEINSEGDASLLYEVADVRAWSYLGLHLAEKLRGAVQLKTFRTTGEDSFQDQAVTHLENALAYWDQVIAVTRPVYKDMPLTPYLHNDNALFHWEYLRPALAEYISIAKKQTVGSLT